MSIPVSEIRIGAVYEGVSGVARMRVLGVWNGQVVFRSDSLKPTEFQNPYMQSLESFARWATKEVQPCA